VANIVVGDVFRVYNWCRLGGVNALNVKAWKCVSVSGAGAITNDNFYDRMSNSYRSLYRQSIATEALYYGFKVTKQHLFDPYQRSEAVSLPGLYGTRSLPPQVSGFISLMLGDDVLHQRGRIFVPFPAVEALTTAGFSTDLYKTTIAQIAAFTCGTVTVDGAVDSAVFRCMSHTQPTSSTRYFRRFYVGNSFATMRSRSTLQGFEFPPAL